jgi:hypothetical protein
MRKRERLERLCARIIREFTVQKRWMGFYMIRHDGDFGKTSLDTFTDAMIELKAQGRLIELWTGDFWSYLSFELLPTPAQLALRCEQIPAEKGGPA